MNPSGIAAELIIGATLTPRSESKWRLRPELVESLFYMWRYTHDPKYRKYGWEIANKIED
jgi:mannosyl-oligosaccharide alpha-1,2-mannosidase